MAGGRPSKYKPEYPEMLIEHMRGGRSYESFAAVVDVCDDTLREWEKVHPEFSASKRRGWMLSMAWWEERMRENLISPEGIKFNTTGWIYTMKCRFPRYWRDQQEVAHVIDDKRELKSIPSLELTKMLVEANEPTSE